jgi:hypothetical protein
MWARFRVEKEEEGDIHVATMSSKGRKKEKKKGSTPRPRGVESSTPGSLRRELDWC